MKKVERRRIGKKEEGIRRELIKATQKRARSLVIEVRRYVLGLIMDRLSKILGNILLLVPWILLISSYGI